MLRPVQSAMQKYMRRFSITRVKRGDICRPLTPAGGLARRLGAWLCLALMLAMMLVMILALPWPARESHAASAVEEARQIMQAVQDREDGDDRSAEVRIILVDNAANRSVRMLRSYQKDFGTAAFSVYFVLSPEDMKGGGLLFYDNTDPSTSDDVWLYEPGDRKPRQVAGGLKGSGFKSAGFMGSDLNYSDLTRPNLQAHSFRLLKEPIVDGIPMWQILMLPRTREMAVRSGYSQSMLWVRKDNLFITRAVRWVHNSRRIKHMRVTRLARIESIWVATEIQVLAKEDNRVVHSTILQLENVQFNQKLRKRLFTLRGLKAGLK